MTLPTTCGSLSHAYVDGSFVAMCGYVRGAREPMDASKPRCPECANREEETKPVPDHLGSVCEPEESLTLNVAARERATEALGEAFEGGYRTHWCSEWLVDGTCEICWDVAAAVIRAAEGLRLCSRCKGSGDVGAGAAVCCDECGGNGLEPTPAASDEERE